jgi:CBS domain-containing protein
MSLLLSLLSPMKRPIQIVSGNETLDVCIERMVKLDIGSLVVMEGEHLLGIMSERDIVRQCYRLGKAPNTLLAKDIAYQSVTMLDHTDSVEKAMTFITQTKRRHILVKDANHQLNLISIGDLLFHMLSEKNFEIEQLSRYIAA